MRDGVTIGRSRVHRETETLKGFDREVAETQNKFAGRLRSLEEAVQAISGRQRNAESWLRRELLRIRDIAYGEQASETHDAISELLEEL